MKLSLTDFTSCLCLGSLTKHRQNQKPCQTGLRGCESLIGLRFLLVLHANQSPGRKEGRLSAANFCICLEDELTSLGSAASRAGVGCKRGKIRGKGDKQVGEEEASCDLVTTDRVSEDIFATAPGFGDRAQVKPWTFGVAASNRAVC
jgi:hypothetical protein